MKLLNCEQRIANLEKHIDTIKHGQKELQILLGKDRYESVVSELKEVLERNGLDEIKSAYLINHLNQIYQLERIRL